MQWLELYVRFLKCRHYLTSFYQPLSGASYCSRLLCVFRSDDNFRKKWSNTVKVTGKVQKSQEEKFLFSGNIKSEIWKSSSYLAAEKQILSGNCKPLRECFLVYTVQFQYSWTSVETRRVAIIRYDCHDSRPPRIASMQLYRNSRHNQDKITNKTYLRTLISSC